MPCRGVTEGVTLLLLALQTGLLDLQLLQRTYLLSIILFIVVTSTLQSMIEIADPIVLGLGASRNRWLCSPSHRHRGRPCGGWVGSGQPAVGGGPLSLPPPSSSLPNGGLRRKSQEHFLCRLCRAAGGGGRGRAGQGHLHLCPNSAPTCALGTGPAPVPVDGRSTDFPAFAGCSGGWGCVSKGGVEGDDPASEQGTSFPTRRHWLLLGHLPLQRILGAWLGGFPRPRPWRAGVGGAHPVLDAAGPWLGRRWLHTWRRFWSGPLLGWPLHPLRPPLKRSSGRQAWRGHVSA